MERILRMAFHHRKENVLYTHNDINKLNRWTDGLDVKEVMICCSGRKSLLFLCICVLTKVFVQACVCICV